MVGPDSAPQLPDDIWARILFHLEGGVGDGLALRYCEPNSLLEAQAEYYRLRLVCRKFDQVFRQQHQLCRGLAVPVPLSDQVLQSLKSWLQKHSSYVQNLAAYCGSPGLNSAIDLLAGPPSKLASIFLWGCSISALNKLTVFTSLTSCELVEPQVSVLNLTPLQPYLPINQSAGIARALITQQYTQAQESFSDAAAPAPTIVGKTCIAKGNHTGKHSDCGR